jgi:hypothetical protein
MIDAFLSHGGGSQIGHTVRIGVVGVYTIIVYEKLMCCLQGA